MKRISVIEALRAAACISVALFHFCSQLDSAGARFAAEYGWLGVDIFFVISGFVIPLSLYGRGYRVRDCPAFLMRRLIRLEPVYLASIFLVLFLLHASSLSPGFHGPSPNYSLPQIASHLFYITPLTPYQWVSPVYWSLAYEFVFYITVGLSFSALIEMNVAATALVGLAAFALSYFAYTAPDVRIIEFVVGALLMRMKVNSKTDMTATACLIAAVTLVFWLGGLATGAVVLFVVCSIHFFRSVDFGKPAIFLGGISYSLYLVHVPVGVRVVNLANRVGGGPLHDSITVALAFLASLLVAMMLNRFVEKPAIAASRKIGNASMVPIYLPLDRRER